MWWSSCTGSFAIAMRQAHTTELDILVLRAETAICAGNACESPHDLLGDSCSPTCWLKRIKLCKVHIQNTIHSAMDYRPKFSPNADVCGLV